VITGKELQRQMTMKTRKDFPRKEALFKTKVLFAKGFCGWFKLSPFKYFVTQ